MSPSISREQHEQNVLTEQDFGRKDLQNTALWHEVTEFYRSIHEPAFDRISSATEIVYAVDQKTIAFTGSFWPYRSDGKLFGQPTQRICLLSADTARVQVVTTGPNNDKSAQWSPDASELLFLSDRRKQGIYLPYILKRELYAVPELLTTVNSSVEYAKWSPDGTKVLLGVVGLGPEDMQSATDPSRREENKWMPSIETEIEDNEGRKLWVYDIKHQSLSPIGAGNSWESSWLGSEQILRLYSAKPGEEDWYHVDVMKVSCSKTSVEDLVQSHDFEGKIRQFGCLAASPNGKQLAFVRALASDRPYTAGEVYIGSNGKTPKVQKVNVGKVDVTYLEFHDDKTLFYAGISGIGFVVGRLMLEIEQDVIINSKHEELFRTEEACADGWLPRIAVVDAASFVCALQSRQIPSRIGIVRDGSFNELHSFAHEGTKWLQNQVGNSTIMRWKSKDGLEIEGLLDLPHNVSEPYPLILHIHGGPTASWQNTWDQWSRIHFLVAKGYAVLSPNPRGSTGRGQEFAEMVLGDVGGMETQDHLSGIDHLIQEGIADPERIGVIGGSHGGFMSTWIITQDQRFKACVPIAAVTDWHSFHYTTNIRNFDPLYVDEDPYNLPKDSKYLHRSPIMMAHKVKTPTLQIAGDIDHCVDKSQGKEFHNALLENGVPSILAVYPGEGHGVRNFPAVYDTTVRTLGWFRRYMPADGVSRNE